MVSLSRRRSTRFHALATLGLALAAVSAGLLPTASLAGQPVYQRPLDVVFIIDRSGSMDQVTPDPGAPIVPGVNNTRLGWANDAANALVSALESAGGVGAGGLHQVGLVTYGGGTSTIDLPLGVSAPGAVHAAIDVWDGLDGDGNTPLKEGMASAVATMTAGGRTEMDGVAVLRVFILLSDGRPNPDPGSRPGEADVAAYLGAVDQAFGIGIGATGGADPGLEPDLALMQAVSSPVTNFSHVVDAASLPNLFASMTDELVYGDIQISSSAAPGGPVDPGTPVTFTYVVWNNSEDTPLHEVSVADAACSAMSGPAMAGGNVDAHLSSGETWTYTCTASLEATAASDACATGHFIAGGSDESCAALTVQVVAPATPSPTPTANPAPTGPPTPSPTVNPAPTGPPSPTPTPFQAPAAPAATPTPSAAVAVVEPSPSPSEMPAEIASPTPTPEPPRTAALEPLLLVPPAPPAAGGSPSQPTDVVGGILAAALQQAGAVVQPQAAVAVATAFSFPLGLMVAVMGFLVGQGRIDARDPKLRQAPRTPKDTVMNFRNEEEL
jgi:hypothetical protein